MVLFAPQVQQRSIIMWGKQAKLGASPEDCRAMRFAMPRAFVHVADTGDSVLNTPGFDLINVLQVG